MKPNLEGATQERLESPIIESVTETFDAGLYTDELKRSWNAAAPHYGRLGADLFPPLTRSFIDFAALKPGQSVLDVACGPGTATELALQAIGAGGKIVGVDLSFEMLKLAGSRLGPVDLREMNAEALDFPNETFDAVICQLGLMLFARPETALREMARVSKVGGRVACLVQGTAEKMQFTSLIMKTMLRRAPEIKAEGAPGLYAFGPEGKLESALKQAGLADVRARRLTGAFAFESVEAYWELMTSGAGRTGAMLKTLPEAAREAVKKDVLAGAAAFRRDGRVEIPFEVVMAHGVKR